MDVLAKAGMGAASERLARYKGSDATAVFRDAATELLV